MIHETYTGSYADQKADLVQEYMMWNHSLSEIFSSLIQNKLVIDQFQEYDYSPYNCFKETLEVAPNRFRIKHLDNKIPMVFSLVATKALSWGFTIAYSLFSFVFLFGRALRRMIILHGS